MGTTLLALAAPIIKQVAPSITDKIKNKISPSEIQQAILAGIKAAEAEDEKLPFDQHLFYLSKPDSLQGVPGFLGKYFKVISVQQELAQSFDNQGKPDVDYLVAQFNQTAEAYKEVEPIESRVKPWLTTFVEAYFQATSTYLKFQVAKQDYFKQLNKRYDNIKFAGIAVSGQEEVKKLQQIFVIPDVVKITQNEASLPEEIISAELPQQQRLILEQKQLARLNNTFNSPLLANKLLTETPQSKAVILGAPGSGKSTLVSYFTVMLTQGKAKDLGLDDDSDWLPIVIEIRDFEQNLNLNIVDYLHRFAESNLTTNQLPPDFFKHWLNRGKALIMLDGVDEVADTSKRYKVVEKINSFLHQYQGNIALITSRPSGYKRDFFATTEFPHYELQPFDDDKIEEFINHWYDSRYSDPQEATRCKDTLRKALSDNDRIKLLAKNPLLITIIALIHRYQAYLPKERYKLYDKAVETLLTSWDANKAISGHKVLKYLDLDDLRRLLESLARWIHSQGSTGDEEGGTQIDQDELREWLSHYIKTNKQRQLNEAREEANRFLDFIRERTGLINEQGTNRYAFVHKTFQEYLCAQDINYEADDEDDFEIVLGYIKEHLHNAHWREVLLLLVAQQKPQKALKGIKAIYKNDSKYEQWLHRDLLFAASCLADSPKGTQVKDQEGLSTEILGNLVNLEVDEDQKICSSVRQQVFKVIDSFVETDWEEEVLGLIKQQEHKIEQFRFLQYQVTLGEKEQAVASLLSLLEDENSDVRFSTAFTLGEIGIEQPEVITALLSLLQDQDSGVRYSAANTLGIIGREQPEVITALLPLLQDQDSNVRYSAANTLGRIGREQPEVITALLSLLQDQDSDVRSSTAFTLGIIGREQPEVITALLSLLQDQDSDVRSSTAFTLGIIGREQPEVITALLSLLQDQDSNVRSSAASALGRIGREQPEVITALLSLLEDQDSNVRSSAASALGRIGREQPEVITALLSLLEDQDSNVRYSAAFALGVIGREQPEVITALLSLLEDQDSNVRSSAAFALGIIGREQPEVITALLSLLQDQDSGVRYSAANTLGIIGREQPEVITALLSLLQDEDVGVRSSAASALGRIGKKKVEMISLLEDWIEKHQDNKYVNKSIDVLWNLVTNDS
jgi:HEAT repeat protein/energy-coupling factor transporter ATP-binding protein EcfA2